MDITQISPDDLLDVGEMTKKLENYFQEVIKDNDKRLGMSALISAMINCFVSQCRSSADLAILRNVLIKGLDGVIIDLVSKGF